VRPKVIFFALGLTLAATSARVAAEEGIPVESDLLRSACGACHESDEKNRMSRISYMRKTPEGWQLTIKRMVRTGRVALTPEQARLIVRYLADHHSLAPAEARSVFYEAEKRPLLEKSPSRDYRQTCIRCHQGSRGMAQRRTAEEWSLLKGMHLGYFPVAESQSFRERPRAEQDGEEVERPAEEEVDPEASRARAEPAEESAPDEGDWGKMRVDRVLEFLAKKYPLETPEWRAFQARKTEVDLSGRWLLTSHQPGRGLVSGAVRLEKVGADYLTHSELWLADGSIEKREGKAVLYAGFDWRGSSMGAALGQLKEVMMLSDDRASLTGRFFTGTFGELGLDVTLVRLGADPRIAGVWPRALPAGAGRAALRIVGANFPADLAAEELSLGPGVAVKEVSRVTPAAIELVVEVGPAAAGLRDVAVRGATRVGAFAVYDRIDYLKVNPGEGMARLGGVRFPKQFVQFEAVAFHRGPDGEPLTPDDIDLGPVAARWSLEEYHIRNDDDDLKYVGTIDQKGFFTPNLEGPNPERRGTNNYGDVWVVAAFAPPGGRELKGRAHLLVTVPLYALWDQPETIP
jgi:quinohemoprotein amine dehydrogenase